MARSPWPHEHDRPVESKEPAEPAGESRSVSDGDRSLWMRPRVRLGRARVDEHRPVSEMAPHGLAVEPSQVGQADVEAGARRLISGSWRK
jgi:hypothetical protein